MKTSWSSDSNSNLIHTNQPNRIRASGTEFASLRLTLTRKNWRCDHPIHVFDGNILRLSFSFALETNSHGHMTLNRNFRVKQFNHCDFVCIVQILTNRSNERNQIKMICEKDKISGVRSEVSSQCCDTVYDFSEISAHLFSDERISKRQGNKKNDRI